LSLNSAFNPPPGIEITPHVGVATFGPARDNPSWVEVFQEHARSIPAGPRSCGGRDGKRHQGEIDAIVAAYQQRFQQQALGVVIASACAAF
jgi:hypothetical protein